MKSIMETYEVEDEEYPSDYESLKGWIIWVVINIYIDFNY
jgi:hypothetical protein